MKTEIRIFLAVAFIAGSISAILVWKNVINKPHRNIEEARADFSLAAADLCHEFTSAADSSQQKYQGRVILITGVILRVEARDSVSSVEMQGNAAYDIVMEVLPEYNEAAKSLKPGETKAIKGLYVGWEEGIPDFDMKGAIKLKKCSFK